MVKVTAKIKTTMVHPLYGEIDIKFDYFVSDTLNKTCGFTSGKAKVKPGKISLYITNVIIESKYIFDDQLYLGVRINSDDETVFKIISNGKNEVFSENPAEYRTLEYTNITPTTEAIKIDIKVYIDKDAANKFDNNIHEFKSLTTQEGEKKITYDDFFQNILTIEANNQSLTTNFSKLDIKPLEESITKEIRFHVIDDSVLMPPKKAKKV